MNVQSQCLFIVGAALLGWVPRARPGGCLLTPTPSPTHPSPCSGRWHMCDLFFNQSRALIEFCFADGKGSRQVYGRKPRRFWVFVQICFL